MKNDEYFIGLDIGTDSVGWAVSDTNYRIQRAHGKALWGIRLFEQAKSKEERRGYRGQRRRYERTKQRIEWLQQVFNDEIAKVDPGFYQRLAESKFLEEDKRDKNGHSLTSRYSLFADHHYTDVDYHKAYPTIYHLRYALMTENHSFDIRLIYLAVHHIMKNRGHFLFEDMNIDQITFKDSKEEFVQAYFNEYDKEFSFGDEGIFERILADRTMGVRKKAAKLSEIVGIGKKDKQNTAIITLLCGGKVKIQDLLNKEVPSDENAIKEICFRESIDDEKEDKIRYTAGENYSLIEGLKKLYDFALLKQIRDGKETISEAKMAEYSQHKENLKRLKAIVKSVGREEYKAVFRDLGKSNYVAYSKHKLDGKSCSYDDFRKFVVALLKPYKEREDVAQLCKEMEEECFLPLQKTSDNGVIPHQLNGYELEKILEKAAVYYSFLNEKDESGFILQERIKQMFNFRLPYYAGPLDSRSPHSWIVRNYEKVYPWNFEQVINVPATAAKFIERMTAKCTYLGEDVLPQSSLLYSRYMVLNELNNICVNGQRLPVDVKQAIYQDLFSKGTKVRLKQLKEYLLQRGFIAATDQITGIDGDFKATLQSQRDFQPYASLLTEQEIDEIIRRSVLFGDDRKLLAVWLKKTYGNKLSPEVQTKICRLKYTGWGRFSAKLLTEIKAADPETGEILSLLDAMWVTNNNLMELLSGRYGYSEQIEAYRK